MRDEGFSIMSPKSRRLLLTISACLFVASPGPCGATSPKVDFLAVEGMNEHSSNLKAVVLTLSPEARAKINRSRWSKGQHQLPENLSGYGFDLDGDGISEEVLSTGEGDPSGRCSYLVIRGLPDRCEIIASFNGSFAFIARKVEWADLVVFEADARYYNSRTTYLYDCRSYVRFKKEVQLHQDSQIQVIEPSNEKPAPAFPVFK